VIFYDHSILTDIIKIDVEGAEAEVIEGARIAILRGKLTIIIEYSEST
jgi:FkbM family methyltransferase